MSYLVCDKCGGYYELKDGESPEDFDDECECGGKLENKESFKTIKSDNEVLDIKSGIGIRIIAIVIGAIIILFFREEPLITIVIAGFITGFIAGGSYKDGIFNTAVAGGTGGIFSFFLFLFSFSLEGKYLCAYHTTLYALIYTLPAIALCLIGGVIAIFLKNRFKG
jgi:uncharacterized membrane protein YeaQ/YmgE (transglycosylase-associated protein family)